MASTWNELYPDLVRRGLAEPAPLTSEASGRRAAVALLLRSAPGGVELLLVRRIERASDPWSGHMALPGGFAQPEDADLLRTAVRETREEVGIDLDRSGQSLGRLDDVAPLRSLDVVVRPFAFAIADISSLDPGPEIQEIVWAKMSELSSARLLVEHRVWLGDRHFSVPGFRLGEHVVWGLTYRVITALIDRTTRIFGAAEFT